MSISMVQTSQMRAKISLPDNFSEDDHFESLPWLCDSRLGSQESSSVTKRYGIQMDHPQIRIECQHGETTQSSVAVSSANRRVVVLRGATLIRITEHVESEREVRNGYRHC